MKMNFSLTSDEYKMFINSYNVENYIRMRNGERIISMSKFFVSLIEFYKENHKSVEIK